MKRFLIAVAASIMIWCMSGCTKNVGTETENVLAASTPEKSVTNELPNEDSEESAADEKDLSETGLSEESGVSMEIDEDLELEYDEETEYDMEEDDDDMEEDDDEDSSEETE